MKKIPFRKKILPSLIGDDRADVIVKHRQMKASMVAYL